MSRRCALAVAVAAVVLLAAMCHASSVRSAALMDAYAPVWARAAETDPEPW